MSDNAIVEFREEFEDVWGENGESTTKVLFDTNGYDEDFPDVVKELNWDSVHYSSETNEDGDWMGWSADADKVHEIKSHFQKNGYATVDMRD